MNGFVNIDPPAESSASTALITITAALPAILAADQNDILGKLAAKVNAHKPDISTPKGRAEIRSLAQEIATSKTALIKLGKTLTEDWRAKTKAVNAECNVIEEQMDGLKVRVRQPLTDFENAEKVRVAAHEAALADLSAFGTIPSEWGSAEIGARIEEFIGSDLRNRPWQEFTTRASDLVADIVDRLNAAMVAAVNREEEAAELVRLRAEEVERQRIKGHEDALAAIVALGLFDGEPDDALSSRVIETRLSLMGRLPHRDWQNYHAHAITAVAMTSERLNALLTAAEAREAAAQAEREAEIAAEAAAEATRIAEAEAARQAEIAARETARREREAAEAIAAAEQKAERQRQATAEAEQRAEARRISDHRAALATMQRLADPLEPPDPVPVIDAKLGQLDEAYGRDWEEFSDEAGAMRAAAFAALTAAREGSVRLAERAAAKVQADILAREQKRVADQQAEQKRLDDIRAANVAHQRGVNRQAVAALTGIEWTQDGAGEKLSEQMAQTIVRWIALGKIPHVTIKY